MSGMQIGTIEGEGPALLLAERFNRHTLWCGQSGSGKTYALGVALEQLLLTTDLPIIVLDPNADFVGLGTPREGADPEAARGIGAADVRVLHSTDPSGTPLRVRFVDLDLRAKAAVLRLDPVADRDEFNVLLRADRELGPRSGEQLVDDLRTSDDPARQRLAMRIENLGVLDWDVWARGAAAVEDLVDERPAATVLDLAGFHHPDEAKVVALSVLDRLWAQRHDRRPVLIVIDEAHNICPADPADQLERAIADRVVQIAAEGRKYGLWLLLSTQRPSKLEPNAVSQCDNLVLMRTTSGRDLADVIALFGYAPPAFVERAPRFRKGQGLFAGGFIESPAIVQLGDRITVEGGRDVAVPVR